MAVTPTQAQAVQVQRQASASGVVRSEAQARAPAMGEVVEGRPVGRQERVTRAG